MIAMTLIPALLAATPSIAMQRPSVLSEVDQQRIVCIAERDKRGKPTAGQICKSGAEWEQALAAHKARVQRAYFPTQHVRPGYFELNAFRPWGQK